MDNNPTTTGSEQTICPKHFLKRKLIEREVDTEQFEKYYKKSHFYLEEDCSQVVACEKSNFSRGGIFTIRLRPCSVPRTIFTRYHWIRFDQYRKFPEFLGIPAWLKPFLYQYNQAGCREERLCSIFRHLPCELLSQIRSACTAVVILALKRMNQAQEVASVGRLCESNEKIENDQWLYEGIGLSDDELETYEAADFGILRCDSANFSLCSPNSPPPYPITRRLRPAPSDPRIVRIDPVSPRADHVSAAGASIP